MDLNQLQRSARKSRR